MPSHMDPAIFVHARLRDKPVVARCGEALRIDPFKAMGHLVAFWGGVSLNATDGTIRDIPDSLLEQWAGWTGKRGTFAAWVRVSHMDADGRVNEWDEFAGKLSVRRQKDRDRQRLSRGRHTDSPSDVTRDVLVTSHESHNIEVRSKKQHPPRAAAPWMGGVREIWSARYQAEPPTAAPKVLRPLVEKHGVDEVLQRLERYLDVTDARFLNLHRFAATYGEWAPKKARGANGLDIPDAETAFGRLGL